jgi:serine/threonine-protein kinase
LPGLGNGTGRAVSHYRILEKIGNGGMSVVYKAQDLHLNRLVALKFLPPHLADSRDAVERLCREARAISALNHPHIATIYELGRANGQFFLALEYLPGGTVRSMVQEMEAAGIQMPVKRLFQFAIEIAEGLCHAHRCGIVHRDVKTDNVMLAADEAVKLTDFGLAKLSGGSRLTQAGSIVGTASYMSPEQARGADVDSRSDIFSFGVVLFEMATGRLPFRGPHEAAILAKILNDPAPNVTDLRPELPEGLNSILTRALEKGPEQRYQDMREMLEDLLAVAGVSEREQASSNGVVGTSTAPGAASWWRRLARRWPWLPAVGLSVAALGVVIGGPEAVRGVFPHQEDPPPAISAQAGAYDLYQEGRNQLQRFDDADSLNRAIGLFQRAMRNDSKFPLAHAGLGEAYWRMYKLTRDPRWLERAGDSCRRSIELGAPMAPVRVTLGLVQSGTGHHQEAIAEFEQAIKADPLNADAWREMGNSYDALGRHRDAETAFLRAIQFRPGDWASHNDMGRFYWGRGDYGKAEEHFRKVIEITPDNARGLSNLGGLYVLMCRFEEAASALERSLAIKPTATAYSNLGTAHFYQQRYEEAARAMEKAVELRPEDYQLWGNLADVYRQMPRRDQDAVAAYRRAIALGQRQSAVNPSDAALRASLAGYYAGLGRKNEALGAIRHAVRLSPSNVNVLLRAAVTYELVGMREEALRAAGASLRGGSSPDQISRHPGLQALRADPRYHEVPAKRSLWDSGGIPAVRQASP